MQQQPLIGTGSLHTAGATGASTEAIDRRLAVDAAEASKTVESSPHFGFMFWLYWSVQWVGRAVGGAELWVPHGGDELATVVSSRH